MHYKSSKNRFRSERFFSGTATQADFINEDNERALEAKQVQEAHNLIRNVLIIAILLFAFLFLLGRIETGRCFEIINKDGAGAQKIKNIDCNKN